MAIPYLPFYVDDYLAETRHLDLAERGLYVDLMSHMWKMGDRTGRARLRDDAGYIARLLGIPVPRWQQARRILVEDPESAMLEAEDGYLVQRRIEEQWDKAMAAYRKMSEGGRATAAKRWNSDQSEDSPPNSPPTKGPNRGPSSPLNNGANSGANSPAYSNARASQVPDPRSGSHERTISKSPEEDESAFGHTPGADRAAEGCPPPSAPAASRTDPSARWRSRDEACVTPAVLAWATKHAGHWTEAQLHTQVDLFRRYQPRVPDGDTPVLELLERWLFAEIRHQAVPKPVTEREPSQASPSVTSAVTDPEPECDPYPVTVRANWVGPPPVAQAVPVVPEPDITPAQAAANRAAVRAMVGALANGMEASRAQ